MMNEKIKNFIEENIDLINQNTAESWEHIYSLALKRLKDDIGYFTEVLLDSDIDPATVLGKVPRGYLRDNKNILEYNIAANIKSIGIEAFYRSRIKQLSIPSSVESIHNSAFSGCMSLDNLVIPNTVKKLGNFAFSTCLNLKKVKLDGVIKNLGTDIFASCMNLIDVDLPSQLTKIPQAMFYNCKSLERIALPDTITQIDDSAFNSCSALKFINFPRNLRYIGNVAFRDCISLTNATFDGTVDEWDRIEKHKRWKYDPIILHCTDSVIKI